MQPDEYRCAMCLEIFRKTWSDEEARAEATAKGIKPQEGCVVCDDCYQKTPFAN